MLQEMVTKFDAIALAIITFSLGFFGGYFARASKEFEHEAGVK